MVAAKFIIHGKRGRLGDCIETFTMDFPRMPNRDLVIANMDLWACRAGWRKKKALPPKGKLYVVKSLGAVLIEEGNLKVEGAEILQTIELGVQRSSEDWKDLVERPHAKAIVVLVDMDKAVPGVVEEDEVDEAVEEASDE